jgi:hypothetical protein
MCRSGRTGLRQEAIFLIQSDANENESDALPQKQTGD